MKTSATLYISYVHSPPYVFQKIRIVPQKRSHIRFFIYDKYQMGRVVDDFLSKIYLGDANTIYFREKKQYRNEIIIKYEIVDETISLDLTEKKYFVEGEVPKFDGCISCEHLRESKRGASRCAYYKIFLDRYKIYCADFYEKEE